MQDVSKFVGQYLRLIGFISLALMLASLLYANFVSVNLSFILLIWAGNELRRHNPRARTWIMRFSVLSIITIILICTYVQLMQIDHLSIDVFGIAITYIPRLIFHASMAGILVICAIPLFFLLKRQAYHECNDATPIEPVVIKK